MNSIEVRPKFGLANVPFGEPTENHLLIEIQGNEDTETAQRPPIVTALCLDVSPSMNGHNKLPLAKKSAIAMIDNLRESDALAMIFFSGDAKVVMPITTINPNTKKLAIEKVSQAFAGGGGTNISSAIIEAYDQIDKFEAGADATKRVIFLTDGCPTAGETRKDRLIEMAKQTPESIGLTTMGFGEPSDGAGYGMGGELDTVLLQNMSSEGKGNYYYMKDADSCRNAFANELAGLLSTAAQDIKITLNAIDSRVEVTEVLDNVDSKMVEGNLTIKIPDILEGETRHILVKVKTLKQGKAWQRLAKVADLSIEYKDVLNAKKTSLDFACKLGFVKKSSASTEVDADVDTQIKLIEAIKAQQDAINMAQGGNFTGAAQLIRSASLNLAGANTDRAAGISDQLDQIGAVYGSQQSFMANIDTLRATTVSMATGKATGGYADSSFTNSKQKEMQDKFTDEISYDEEEESKTDSPLNQLVLPTDHDPNGGFNGLGHFQPPSFGPSQLVDRFSQIDNTYDPFRGGVTMDPPLWDRKNFHIGNEEPLHIFSEEENEAIKKQLQEALGPFAGGEEKTDDKRDKKSSIDRF